MERQGIVDLSTGRTNYYESMGNATMGATFRSSERRAHVTFSWYSKTEVPLPADLRELGEAALAEAEWRAVPCGVEPAPAGPAAGAPPAAATPRPVPLPATDARLPCTCRDAAGKPYRMTISGAECDPLSWLRSDDCRP
jgi:hypothetical protein